VIDGELIASLRRAYERLAPDGVARFPLAAEWDPSARAAGTAKPLAGSGVRSTVPDVPTVPTPQDYGCSEHSAPCWGDWQERAAIRECDGGINRAEADRLTAEELGPCPSEPSKW
jgi:hypothetical protein